MKVIIVGAGEVGRGFASVVCGEGHEVVMIDNSSKLLKRVAQSLDVMTVQGNGVSSELLRRLAPADLLVAATGEDTTNILACQLASHMGVRQTICRLSSEEYFNQTPDFFPSLIGINQIIIPSLECVDKIVRCIEHRAIIEKILFKDVGAEITCFKMPNTSPLLGVRLRDFPDSSLIGKIRFCGILRGGKFIIPRGETVFATDDDIFVAGLSGSVMELIEWASGEKPTRKGDRIIIGGAASPIGRRLAKELLGLGYDVRVIEQNVESAESLLDELGKGLMVIIGDPTDRDMLEEAGVSGAPCFISVMEDDEDNIMSCMLAKKKGAIKTVSIVNKADYGVLFSSLDMVDCFFSPSSVGVNSALKFLEEEKSRVLALVNSANSFVFDLKVEKDAELCGTRIADFRNLPEMVFAFVARNGTMLPATGDLRLEAGDRVTMISDFDTIRKIEPYFYAKG